MKKPQITLILICSPPNNIDTISFIKSVSIYLCTKAKQTTRDMIPSVSNIPWVNLFNSTWVSHHQHHNKNKINSINPLLLEMLSIASSDMRDINKNLPPSIRCICLKIKLLSGLTHLEVSKFPAFNCSLEQIQTNLES